MTTAAQRKARRNRDTIFLEDGRVLAKDSFAGNQFVMRIRAPDCAAAAEPGMFVHLNCDPALPMRRPMSIMRASEDWIEILFKIVGDGLRLLAARNPGDSLSVLGPIGQPFSLNPRRTRPLLVGGGVGIPPMVFLADRLRRDPGLQPFAILGSELPFPFDRAESSLAVGGIDDSVTATIPLLEEWNIPARLTSLAGFDGCYRGYVTDLAALWLDNLDDAERLEVEILACGPTPMLRATARLAERFGLPCQVSLEEYMACAVGGCAGCTVRIETEDGPAMKRVCVDGPVFDAYRVVWPGTATQIAGTAS